ncbi:MAG: Gx transporter family protein [Bacilli bacterium]|nr:Gx transporter family protein [Bacilli bacterium]
MNRVDSKTQIKRIILLANLVAVSVIFSYFDKMVSQAAFPFLPTAKIGLANIVILLGVYRFEFKETLVMTTLKVVLSGLLIGGLISFVISAVASFLSFIGMYVFHKILKERVSPISISVIGGFIHIVAQLLVVNTLYQVGDAILYYGAIMIFISLITSVLIGFVSFKLFVFFDKTT